MVKVLSLGFMLASLLAAPSVVLAAAQGLPEGVTSIQEVYQDWRVNCVQGQPAVQCTMSQEQTQNGQRVLAMELTAAGDAGVTGTLVLPFGLELSAGAILQVDDGGAEPPRAFKTCLPAGCTVQVAFNKAQLDVLSKAKVLKVSVTAADNNQQASFGISLKGFGAALARTAALSQ